MMMDLHALRTHCHSVLKPACNVECLVQPQLGLTLFG